MSRPLIALLANLPAAAFAGAVTIETATGPMAVEAPESVAVFELAAVDTLEALGVPVDGTPSKVYLEYLEDVAADAKPIGTLFEPDFEALAIMAPDLIVVGGRTSTQVEPLSKVATTIDMTVTGGELLDQAKDRLAAYGTLFGKEDVAAELLASLDGKLDTLRGAVKGKGTALILLTNGGKVSAYGGQSRFGWIHTATGLPEAHPEIAVGTHGEAVSFEFIAEVNPDWILVIDRGAAIGQDGKAASATLDNALVAGTTAGQNDQIVYLSSGPIYIAGGGVQSLTHTMDELIAAFGPAN